MGKATRLKTAASGWLEKTRLTRRYALANELLQYHATSSAVDLQPFLREQLANSNVVEFTAAIRATIYYLRGHKPKARILGNVFTASIRALSFSNLKWAIAFGEEFIEMLPDPRATSSLVDFHRRQHNYRRALELLEKIPEHPTYQERKPYFDLLAQESTIASKFETDLRTAIADGDSAFESLADRMLKEADPPLAVHRALFRASRVEFRSSKRLSSQVIRHGLELMTGNLPERSPAFDVCDAYLHQGQITQAGALLDQLEATDDERLDVKRGKVAAFANLHANGFSCSLPPPKPADDEVLFPSPGRVLWPLHNSLPHDSGGYATRTHGLLTAVRAKGWRVRGVSRLGYPQDRPKHKQAPREEFSLVDDVHYHRLHREGSAYGQIPLDQYLHNYAEELYSTAKRLRPCIIHAPANHMNGLAANAVGKALGIPTIYEVRGLWEITRISRQPEWEGTEYFEMMSRLEVQAAMDADRVICITNALRDEMVRRGVPADKITIVPNGVNVERFVPRARNLALAKALGLADKRVIGYIGSIVDYEGLDTLLQALKLLKQRGISGFAALIIGDGAALEGLQALAAELELGDTVVFTGRIPHEQVEDHYSVVDIAPFPRKSLPVTEMVSPLKPFEAMAMNKTVVSSNVAALAEIVEHGVNGYLFEKDNVEALADALISALDPQSSLGDAPRAWVIKNRSWEVLAAKADGLYRELTSDLENAEQVPLSSVAMGKEVGDILERYREQYAESSPGHVRRDDYARWSAVAARLGPGASLLDVGVGAGQFVNAMSLRGNIERIVGVDRRPHSKFLELVPGFSMEYCSIESMPFGADEFDIVTCMETIEHLPDAIFEAGIAELRRVCAKQLLITVPFREQRLSSGHHRRFDTHDLSRLFPTAQVTIFRKDGSKDREETFWALVEETMGAS